MQLGARPQLASAAPAQAWSVRVDIHVLNHDGNLVLMSGADSRGTNSIIELTTKHTEALAACEVFMLVECTGVVKIGKNGQLAVDE